MNSAIAELSLAGALWGFSFVAAAWGLQSLGFLSLTASRFAISIVCGGSLTLMLGARRDLFSRKQFLLSFWPGLFLSLTLILQTWGLVYTTPTRSGFITCLYILIVPVLESYFFKKRLSKWHLLYVVLALIGTTLICDLHGLGGWNKGDLITLGCTLAASAQILYFGFIADQIGSAIAFNTLQSFWAMLLPLGLFPFFEKFPQAAFNAHSLFGILALGVGSSTLGFMLQIRAQKKISPSTASMLFLLESPFALLFSISLMGEVLKSSQWLGAAIILVAVGLSTQVGQRNPPISTKDLN